MIFNLLGSSRQNEESPFYIRDPEVKNNMPSEKVLSSKKELVEQLKKRIAGSVSGVLVDYKGISVADDTKLRKELREAGVEYTVVKNTLVRFAVEGTGFEGITSMLEGTTALATSQDPIAAARILNNYAEKSKGAFSLKAGYIDGEILDAAGVTALAKMPSKEQLLSMLCSALQGNIRGLACAINAIAEKDGDAA